MGCDWLIFENIAQEAIGQHEVWSWAMMVELGQYHNSKIEPRVELIHTLLK
jgi:hypothetical protein